MRRLFSSFAVTVQVSDQYVTTGLSILGQDVKNGQRRKPLSVIFKLTLISFKFRDFHRGVIEVPVFSNMTQRRWVNGSRRFEGVCRLCFQVLKVHVEIPKRVMWQ